MSDLPMGRGRGRGLRITSAEPTGGPPPRRDVDDQTPEQQGQRPAAQLPPHLSLQDFEPRPNPRSRAALASGTTEPARSLDASVMDPSLRSRGRGSRGRGRTAAALVSSTEERMPGASFQSSPPPASLEQLGDYEAKFVDAIESLGRESPAEPSRMERSPEQGSPAHGQAQAIGVHGGQQEQLAVPAHPEAAVAVDQQPTVDPDIGTNRRGSSKHTGSSADFMTARQDQPIPKKEPCHRVGTIGQPTKLKANYLRLERIVADDKHPLGIAEYHVTLEPNYEDVSKRRRTLNQFSSELGTARSFDGMLLFLPKILPKDVTVLNGYDPYDKNEDVTKRASLKVIITFAKVRDIEDLKTMQCYNILLRRMMKTLDYVEMRREYYDPKPKIEHRFDNHKLQIWRGKDVVVEHNEGGLMLSINTCNRVLRTETVFDFYKRIFAGPNVTENRRKFEELVVNKYVITNYNSRIYKVDEVGWNMTPEQIFNRKGADITIAQYLKEVYGVTVKNMNQPMLLSKVKPRKNERYLQKREESERILQLVGECCQLTGLTEEQKGNFKVMSDLASVTRLNPQKREQEINEFIKQFEKNETIAALFAEWNLKIVPRIMTLPGRILEGPSLQFDPKRAFVNNVQADFTRDATRAIHTPIKVTNFLVLCAKREFELARKFVDLYQQNAKTLGISWEGTGRIVQVNGPMNPKSIREGLERNTKPEDTKFVVIIMPTQNDAVYTAIKKFCISEKPLPSQCIVAKTLNNEKRVRSVVIKVAMQINCKLGGGLWAIDLKLKKLAMFVGIDVAHDPLKKKDSVICMVASVTRDCTKYFSKSFTQKAHAELGEEGLKPMMLAALDVFRKNNGAYPSQIVVFRDGGSEGALPVIHNTEANVIKEACLTLCSDDLKFSFVIVGKRIAQRFFQIPSKPSTPLENPAPGTVVDDIVTKQDLYDFYVVSQKVNQGTVNPTHFIVIDPSDQVPPNVIQKISYQSCFMYYNWTGTVRVPAMVQYAHKLAALLSHHVDTPPDESISESLYYL